MVWIVARDETNLKRFKKLEDFSGWKMNIRLVHFFSFFMAMASVLIPVLAAAQGNDKPLIYRVSAGLLLHDRGPTADDHEDGIDPNIEIKFNPPSWELWQKIGAPYPTLGVTPNLVGDTSAIYTNMTYERDLSGFEFTRNMFVAGGIGIALHNGPLHKDPVRCRANSDCGFGYRVLPHFSVELGYKLKDNSGISLYYDHMSHQHLLHGENEGIDHIGLRYIHFFGQH